MSETYDSAFFDLRPAKYRIGDSIRLKDEKSVKIIGIDPITKEYIVIDSHGKSYPVKPDEISNKLNIDREKSPEELEKAMKKQQDELTLNGEQPVSTEGNEPQEVQQPVQQTIPTPDMSPATA